MTKKRNHKTIKSRNLLITKEKLITMHLSIKVNHKKSTCNLFTHVSQECFLNYKNKVSE